MWLGWPLEEKEGTNPSDKEEFIAGNEKAVQAGIIGNAGKVMELVFKALGARFASFQVGNTNKTGKKVYPDLIFTSVETLSILVVWRPILTGLYCQEGRKIREILGQSPQYELSGNPIIE